MELEDADLRILEELRSDGRVPFEVVAANTRLPQAEVERRVAALRASGMLTVVGFLNTRKLGYDEIHYHIAVDPARIPELAERLKASPHVRYVARVSGSKPLYLNCLFAEPSEREAFEAGPLRDAVGDAARDQHLVEDVYAASYDYSLMKGKKA